MPFMKRIYLDYAAATPIDTDVAKIMHKTEKEFFANPSALHKDGVEARKVLEEARSDIARLVGARAKEIVFVGSATEANSLAILGSAREARKKYGKDRVIVSAIEHPSGIECAGKLKEEGFKIDFLPVTREGIVDTKVLKNMLKPETALVSVIYANNEIGTVQPIREVAKVLRKFRKDTHLGVELPSGEEGGRFPLLHTDAAQAMNYLDVSVPRLGVDLMSWNSSKVYGPKGIGVLFVRDGVELEPLFFGGGQESGRRSGTEDLARIVGFFEAMKKAREMSEKESKRLTGLRDLFIQKVHEAIPEAILNGSESERLPNNVNFSFLEKDAEEIVLRLDASGIAASTRSACASGPGSDEGDGGSYVVRALGEAQEGEVYPYSSVRFSLGRGTTKKNIDETAMALKTIIEKF